MKKILLLVSLFTSATPASAQQYFCPKEEIPYDFVLFEDVLMINRAYHKAFCQKKEGTEYECLEKYPDDADVSVYTVYAEILENGNLGFWYPDQTPNEPPLVVQKCE
ncbi:hypothetical protein FMN50_11535 [Rhodobacterales bacterium]|nr:hypothetical protein FMN50_11535 [Rhodobacterales bacterium]